MSRLWLKLTAALVLVAMLAAGSSVLVIRFLTARTFQSFVRDNRLEEMTGLAAVLGSYYASEGSWDGLESARLWLPDRMPHGMGPAGRRPWPFQVADASGVVVAGSPREAIGRQLSKDELSTSIAIEADGQTVGFLLPDPAMQAFTVLEEAFINRTTLMIVFAGVTASGAAIILGLFLTWQLTGPLRKLTEAAQGIASGDLNQRVDIRSKDELGELGQAFNQMAQNLARAETLRRNMVADIAHELRTPLSVIQGSVEAILDGVFEPTRENVQSIHKETVLLSRLVDDLRELALAEAGQLRIEQEESNLAALIERSVAGISHRARENGVTLTTDLSPHLPLVPADPQRIGQVLSNLLDNALRYTPSGREITVRATKTEGMVQVDVTDQGPGLARGELSLVFERFYRGDRARSRATGGAGLGLAIVKQLVEAHGGKVWAESGKGDEGATFSFTLPISA